MNGSRMPPILLGSSAKAAGLPSASAATAAPAFAPNARRDSAAAGGRATTGAAAAALEGPVTRALERPHASANMDVLSSAEARRSFARSDARLGPSGFPPPLTTHGLRLTFHPPPWLGLAWLAWLGLAWQPRAASALGRCFLESLRPDPHGREGGRKSRKQTDHGTNSSTGIRGDGGRKRPKGERRAARRVGGN